MPRGDRRGPGGMGPMTGRGLGNCTRSDVSGFASNAPARGGGGFGYGRGRGFGRGWGFRHNSAPGLDVDPVYGQEGSRPDLAGELASLKAQVKALEARLTGDSNQD